MDELGLSLEAAKSGAFPYWLRMATIGSIREALAQYGPVLPFGKLSDLDGRVALLNSVLHKERTPRRNDPCEPSRSRSDWCPGAHSTALLGG